MEKEFDSGKGLIWREWLIEFGSVAFGLIAAALAPWHVKYWRPTSLAACSIFLLHWVAWYSTANTASPIHDYITSLDNIPYLESAGVFSLVFVDGLVLLLQVVLVAVVLADLTKNRIHQQD